MNKISRSLAVAGLVAFATITSARADSSGDPPPTCVDDMTCPVGMKCVDNKCLAQAAASAPPAEEPGDASSGTVVHHREPDGQPTIINLVAPTLPPASPVPPAPLAKETVRETRTEHTTETRVEKTETRENAALEFAVGPTAIVTATGGYMLAVDHELTFFPQRVCGLVISAHVGVAHAWDEDGKPGKNGFNLGGGVAIPCTLKQWNEVKMTLGPAVMAFADLGRLNGWRSFDFGMAAEFTVKSKWVTFAFAPFIGGHTPKPKVAGGPLEMQWNGGGGFLKLLFHVFQ